MTKLVEPAQPVRTHVFESDPAFGPVVRLCVRPGVERVPREIVMLAEASSEMDATKGWVRVGPDRWTLTLREIDARGGR